MKPLLLLFQKLLEAKCARPGRQRTSRRQMVRPTSEQLENRLAPATLTWIGGTGGNWSTGANWDTGNKPMNGDSVILGSAASNQSLVNDSGATSLQSIELMADHVTVFGSARTTITGGITVDAGAFATLHGGFDFSAGASLVCNGELQLPCAPGNGHGSLPDPNGGLGGTDLTIQGTGRLDVFGPGTLSGNVFVFGVTAVIYGTTALSGFGTAVVRLQGPGAAVANEPNADNLDGEQLITNDIRAECSQVGLSGLYTGSVAFTVGTTVFGNQSEYTGPVIGPGPITIKSLGMQFDVSLADTQFTVPFDSASTAFGLIIAGDLTGSSSIADQFRVAINGKADYSGPTTITDGGFFSTDQLDTSPLDVENGTLDVSVINSPTTSLLGDVTIESTATNQTTLGGNVTLKGDTTVSVPETDSLEIQNNLDVPSGTTLLFIGSVTIDTALHIESGGTLALDGLTALHVNPGATIQDRGAILIDAGASLVIDASTLTVQAGAQLEVDGSLGVFSSTTGNGVIELDGTLTGDDPGSIMVDMGGTLRANGSVPNYEASIDLSPGGKIEVAADFALGVGPLLLRPGSDAIKAIGTSAFLMGNTLQFEDMAQLQITGSLQFLGGVMLGDGETFANAEIGTDGGGDFVALLGTVDGPGTLRLTGGGVAFAAEVSAGATILASSLTSTPVVVQWQGTLDLGSMLEVGNLGTGAPGTVNLLAAASGPGTIQVEHDGLLLALASVPDFTGDVDLQPGGSITVGAVNALGHGTLNVSAEMSQIQVTGTQPVTLDNPLALQAGARLQVTGALDFLASVTFEEDSLSGGPEIDITAGSVLTLEGTVDGAGVLALGGSGTVDFLGEVTDGTTILAGSNTGTPLQVQWEGTLDPLGTLHVGSTLGGGLKAMVDLLTGASGSGSIVVMPGGTLTASADDTGFLGVVMLSGGTIQVGADHALGLGSLELAGGLLQNTGDRAYEQDNAALDVTGAVTINGGPGLTFTGDFTDAVGSDLSVHGTVTLAGGSEIDAQVTVLADGTLHLAGTTDLVAGSLDDQGLVTVEPGGDFHLDSASTLAISGTGLFNDRDTLTADSGSTITLAGSATFEVSGSKGATIDGTLDSPSGTMVKVQDMATLDVGSTGTISLGELDLSADGFVTVSGKLNAPAGSTLGLADGSQFAVESSGTATLQGTMAVAITGPHMDIPPLVVDGHCDLSGAVLHVTLQIPLITGETFTVVQGDLNLSGQFAGLGEGSVLTVGGHRLRTTYTGGPGHDIELTNLTAPLTITTPSLPDGDVNSPYLQTILAAGGMGTYTFSVTSGALPAGLTLSSSGVLSGTPTTTGSSPFVVTVTDGAGTMASQNYTVAINSPVAIAPASLPNGTPNQPGYNQTITASGGTGTFTFRATGTLPTGLTLSSTGVLSGTPTSAGTFSFTVTATDAVGGSASRNYTVAISPGPLSQYLVAVAGSSITPAGSSFLVTVQAADALGNAITSYSGPATVTASSSPTTTTSSLPTSVAINGSGLGFFLARFQQAGIYTIAVAGASISGSSLPVVVTPGPPVSLAITAKPATMPTGITLPPVTVEALDQYGNLATNDNTDSVTVAVASGPGSFTVGSTLTVPVHDGLATFSNLTLVTPGTYQLGVIVPGRYTGPVSAVFNVAPLQVVPTSFVGTPSGFSLRFNSAFLVNSVTPVLYGHGFGATGPVPSVTLTQARDGNGNLVNNPIAGSLVLSAATNSITFVATNTSLAVGNSSPVLPDGTYVVDIAANAAANGFQALGSGGGFLDGLGKGIPGSGDYKTTFIVNAAAKNDDVLWVPATAEGPGQALNAPGNNQIGGGYPIYLSDSTGAVTSVQLTLNYNPALLTVSGASGAGFSLLGTSTPGHAVLHYSGPALPVGMQTALGFLTATVPAGTAANPTPYKAKDLLHLSGVSLNSGAIPVVTGDGLHLVAYVGDADGNGTYSSNDAVLITRVALQTDTGFTAYPLVDPVIVADTDGAGFIPADAPLQANEAGVGFPTPNLSSPPIPSGVHFQAIANNVDPHLSLPALLNNGPDGTVTVPVNIDDAHPQGSSGLIEAHLALTYDPRQFSVSAADIHLGTLLAASQGWNVLPTINPVTGQIALALSSTTPITTSFGGSLVTIDFHQSGYGEPSGVSRRVPTLGAIALVASVNPTGLQVIATELEDAQGTFTLSPVPTNAFDPRIDSVVVLAAAPVAPVSDGALVSTTSEQGADAPRSPGDGSRLVEVHAVETTTDSTAPAVLPEAGDQEAAAGPTAAAVTAVIHLGVASGHGVVAVGSSLTVTSSLGAAPIGGLLLPLAITPVVNTPGSVEAAAWQHLAEQWFQMVARFPGLAEATLRDSGTETGGRILAAQRLLSPSASDDLDVLDWQEAVGEFKDQGVAPWSAPRDLRSQRDAASRRTSPATVASPLTERAALDQVFAQTADDSDSSAMED